MPQSLAEPTATPQESIVAEKLSSARMAFNKILDEESVDLKRSAANIISPEDLTRDLALKPELTNEFTGLFETLQKKELNEQEEWAKRIELGRQILSGNVTEDAVVASVLLIRKRLALIGEMKNNFGNNLPSPLVEQEKIAHQAYKFIFAELQKLEISIQTDLAT